MFPVVGPVLFLYIIQCKMQRPKGKTQFLLTQPVQSLLNQKMCIRDSDHHDTGGTDSPFRETSNIRDGSNVTADMATSVFAGNAARGMSLCALHNGGGVGIGKSINGGFGCVLDGSERIDEVKMCIRDRSVKGMGRLEKAFRSGTMRLLEIHAILEGKVHHEKR